MLKIEEEKKVPKIQTIKKRDTASVAILGDSLAVGLYIGLTHLARKNEKLKVQKYSRVNTGLVRYDRYDWSKAAKKISQTDDSNIYILMFGANDLQSIRENSKAYHFQSKGWVKHYNERIDEITNAVKKPGREVFWVGLPIVGKSNFADGYQYLNDMFRARAKLNGITYIDSWDWFANSNGKFQMSGETADGKKRLLRAKDKVHFTPAGYADLGVRVAKEMQISN
ncbi:DUF459 domain-containing protein [Cohaesibacter sp. ES.047]|uniref:SGNH/GDSL hydrolase family protein n=1 Tax=Cohaesibacter sp. ES.047 TaxID=1798205 RepID=UPI0012FE23AF|nr:DUF459 domain-containing protein [Cohaesibacter sp. ES.047]